MRLFLCDDNPEYRALARVMLERDGHEVVGEAADGLEVLQRAPDAHAEVFVLDLNMPGLSGHDALPRLRAALPHAKIVVLTSSPVESDRERALEGGADAVVVKPESVFALAGLLTAAAGGEPQN